MRTEAQEAQTCASAEASAVQAAWLEQGPTCLPTHVHHKTKT